MFLLHSVDGGNLSPWQYLPCKAITPKVGLGLKLDSVSGQLEVSKTPQFICMRDESSAVAAGTVIPVVRISPDQVWESTLDAATAFKIGEAADLDATGLLVSGTVKTTGTFRLEYLADVTAGSVVRGRFVK